MATRRLPFELQALLHQALSFRPPPSTALQYVRRRAITIPAHVDFTAQTLQAAADDLPQAKELFEPPSYEYDDMPLSKLDHPDFSAREPPRSPTQALVALLEAKQFDEAELLRRDLLDSQQLIEAHLAFATHAHQLFAVDHASNWLDWWSLTPTVSSLASEGSVPLLREGRRTLARHAEEMLLELLQDDDRDWARMRDFAALLARQGVSWLASEHLMVHMAAYAPSELAEDLWTAQLNALDRRHREGMAMPHDAMARNTPISEQTSQRQPQPLTSTPTSSLRDWYIRAADFETQLLLVKRQQMIRTYANFGRIEFALQMLYDTLHTPSPTGEPIHFRKSTYLSLMATAAAMDRYDIFSRLHAQLRASGGRLTRVRLAQLRRKMAYFVRGAAYEAHDPAPSASEAYATWRYRRDAAEMETSLTEAEEDDSDGVSSSKSLFVEEMASPRPDFAKASHLFMVAITEQDLPPTHATASFILLAYAQDRSSVLAQLGAILNPTKGVRERLSKHWQTAAMLADVQRGAYDEALRRYLRNWIYTGLPASMLSVLQQGKKPQRGAAKKHRYTTDSYVLSLVVEALVRSLSSASKEDADVSSATNPLVESIYRSLVEPHMIRIEPKRTNTALTPLDSHTFTPFMSRLFDLKASPDRILDIMLDMQHLQLAPTIQQLGILLASLASRGAVADVFYLLDAIELADRSTPPHLDRLSILDFTEPRKLDVIAYTGILRGLNMQGEWAAAQEIVDRMQSKRVVPDGRWQRAVAELERGSAQGIVVGRRETSVAEEARAAARLVQPLTV